MVLVITDFPSFTATFHLSLPITNFWPLLYVSSFWGPIGSIGSITRLLRLMGYLFDMPFGYCKKVCFSNGVLSLSCNRQLQCQSLNSQRFGKFSHFRTVASFILSSCPFIGFLVLPLLSLELWPLFLMLCFSSHRNIVSTVNLDCKLDLKSIALQARNAEYNPKVSNSYYLWHAVFMRVFHLSIMRFHKVLHAALCVRYLLLYKILLSAAFCGSYYED